MPSSDEYKRQIMNDLASGNVDSLDDESTRTINQYDNFDDFAQQSSREERRHLFGKAFHPDRVPIIRWNLNYSRRFRKLNPTNAMT